jgi:uncharacterized protein (UPF0332 family)
VDWFLYYDLAQQWVGHGGEAHERAAVSRAYYAMFCTARNELRDSTDDYSPPECGSEHVYVWNSYKEDRHPRGTRQIGVVGNRLRRYRNRADYDDLIVDFPDLLEDAMDAAQVLKEHLEYLRV